MCMLLCGISLADTLNAATPEEPILRPCRCSPFDGGFEPIVKVKTIEMGHDMRIFLVSGCILMSILAIFLHVMH